jgi:hypothetical protein
MVHEQVGAYFAGRAVDYVILIALLPFSLLAIPAFLSTADYAIGRDRNRHATGRDSIHRFSLCRNVLVALSFPRELTSLAPHP